MKKEKGIDLKKGALIGAGVAGVLASLAGAYFLYGAKNASKNRKQVKSWMLKAKGEILERIEDAKDLSEEAYHDIVKEVSAKYQQVKKIDSKEVEAFVSELKSHWKGIKKDVTKVISGKSKK